MNFSLQSLFYGDLRPFEQIVPQDAEYMRVETRIDEEEKYFTEGLTPEDAKRFEKFIALFYHLICLSECESFSYGFKYGIRLMSEACAE